MKKYDPDAEIIIFGSRTDLTKKGGDIDILVVSDKIDYRKEERSAWIFFKTWREKDRPDNYGQS